VPRGSESRADGDTVRVDGQWTRSRLGLLFARDLVLRRWRRLCSLTELRRASDATHRLDPHSRQLPSVMEHYHQQQQTWSSFMQMQAAGASSSSSQPPSPSCQQAPQPRPSSSTFVTDGLQAHQSSRARALSAAASPLALAPMHRAASVPSTPERLQQEQQRQLQWRNQKRPREDNGADEQGNEIPHQQQAYQQHDDGAMDDGENLCPPPPLHRLTSLEYEQKYSGEDSTDLPISVQHPSKKQCQKQSLSVHVEPHISSSTSTSPFMQLHIPQQHHAPSASMPTSLSASPALQPLQGAHVTFGSTFTSVGSSPMSSMLNASATPVFQSLTAMQINTPSSQSHHQHLQLPASGFTNQPNSGSAALQSFSFASQAQQQHHQQQLQFQLSNSVFAQSLELPQQLSASATFSPTTTSNASFRPSSAPPTRPTLSIVNAVAGAWHLPQPAHPSRHTSNSGLQCDERMANISPPSSPVDAIEQQYQSVQHPTSPSRNSPSLSSSIHSIPQLQQIRSMTGATAGSSSETAHPDQSALSSLQSSRPPSPAGRSRSQSSAMWYPSSCGGGGVATSFRSISPSTERQSYLSATSAHIPLHGHSAASTLHTPVSSPMFHSEHGLLGPSIEIGTGSLYIPQTLVQQQQQQSPAYTKPPREQETAFQADQDQSMEF
jgi:hypothetical protein